MSFFKIGGLTFLLISGVFPTRAQTQEQKIFFTSKYKILRVGSDGQNPQTILEPTLLIPSSVCVDQAGGKIYWSENAGFIRRSNLDGTQVEQLYEDDHSILSLALDLPRNQMLWISSYENRIHRANLDGTNVQDVPLIQESPGYIDLTVDSAAGKIYWAGKDSYPNGHISRANLDGSNQELLIASIPNLEHFALNPEENTLYIQSQQSSPSYYDQIQRVNLNAPSLVTIYQTNQSILDLSIEASTEQIYWVESGRLRKANLDGSEMTTLLSLPGQYTRALANSNGILFLGSAYEISTLETSGANFHSLIKSEIAQPYALAYDPVTEKVFWADSGFQKIRSCNLDGTEASDVVTVTSTYDTLGSFSLHMGDRRVFWIEYSFFNYATKLQSAEFDGSNVTNHFLLYSNSLRAIENFTIDSAQNRIFWTKHNYDRNDIWTGNLDGTNIHFLFSQESEGYGYLRDIEFDPGTQKLYWFNSTFPESLWRASLDGSDMEELFPNQFGTELALDLNQNFVYWKGTTDAIFRGNLLDYTVEAILVLGEESCYECSGLSLETSSRFVSSVPPACSVDARTPHHVENEAIRYGWNSFDLQFNFLPAQIPAGMFSLAQLDSNQIAPQIATTSLINPNTVRVNLSSPIQAGAWTCLQDNISGAKACFGYLPGDVNGDGITNPVDILAIINNLNGQIQPPYPSWQSDINRSGSSEPSDILGLIDVLNGAGALLPWNGTSLSDCPN